VLDESSGNLYVELRSFCRHSLHWLVVGPAFEMPSSDKVSTTTDEERSLIGSYRSCVSVFTQIYDKLKSENGLDEHRPG
jgi:hypothetical protein